MGIYCYYNVLLSIIRYYDSDDATRKMDDGYKQREVDEEALVPYRVKADLQICLKVTLIKNQLLLF